MSVASVQEAGAATLRAAEDFVNRKIDDTAFREAVEHLYDTVRSIKTGVEVGATADKLFRQSNLLKTSSEELVNAVQGGGSIEPFYTRVKNGTNNVQKTAQQLIEEGGI